MNKDLPKVIKDIFANPDPIIWNGVWLETLEILLRDINLLTMWNELLNIIKNNHRQNTHININQYIKWEIKAFVAQIVKLKQSNLDLDKFRRTLKTYLLKKNLRLDEKLILKIYNSIYEN